MAKRKSIGLKCGDSSFPSRRSILTYYRMKRHELHLDEKDTAHGVFYYSALDTAESNGEDAIRDSISPRVDDIAVDKVMAQKLLDWTTAITSIPVFCHLGETVDSLNMINFYIM